MRPPDESRKAERNVSSRATASCVQAPARRRGVRSGIVTGTTRPLHVGRSTQVWEIRVEDAAGKLVCISRLTLAVVPKP